MTTSFSDRYLDESSSILAGIDRGEIERVASGLAGVRARGGRLFVLGVGGSAGHASHAVNDFRKLCDIEAYAPTDNVSELTARTNDEGWETTFEHWFLGSRLSSRDGVLDFSHADEDRSGYRDSQRRKRRQHSRPQTPFDATENDRQIRVCAEPVAVAFTEEPTRENKHTRCDRRRYVEQSNDAGKQVRRDSDAHQRQKHAEVVYTRPGIEVIGEQQWVERRALHVPCKWRADPLIRVPDRRVPFRDGPVNGPRPWRQGPRTSTRVDARIASDCRNCGALPELRSCSSVGALGVGHTRWPVDSLSAVVHHERLALDGDVEVSGNDDEDDNRYTENVTPRTVGDCPAYPSKEAAHGDLLRQQLRGDSSHLAYRSRVAMTVISPNGNRQVICRANGSSRYIVEVSGVMNRARYTCAWP